MKKWKTIPDDVVFAVCDRFMLGEKVSAIAKWVEREKGLVLNREEIYPLVVEGRERDLIRLIPPTESTAEVRIRDLLARVQGRATLPRVTVPSTGGGAGAEHVAAAAADVVMATIHEIWRRKRKDLGREKESTRYLPRKLWKSSRAEENEDWQTAVHLGLGAGLTTQRVAMFLAGTLKRSGDERPNIYIHALTSGHSVGSPQTSPMYYFSFFHGIPGIGWVSFYAPPYVREDDYDLVRSLPGVKPAYEARSKIDVVITAFGSRQDGHGDYTRFMGAYPDLLGADSTRLERAGWIGDVQYRPYSDTGPITATTTYRPATLFELSDLAQMAIDPQKAVILVAGPCRTCGSLRGDALLPLLRSPSLAVWSHLIVDLGTANQCIGLAWPT
jgi:hypothetical protein